MKVQYKFILSSILLLSCFAFILPKTKSSAASRTNSIQKSFSVADSIPAYFTKISAGGSFTLALKSDNTVWAWGNNQYGQLGLGNIKESTFPVLVDITDVVSISAGMYHALAVKKDGTVWAWGDNTHGQLGDGTNKSSNVPVQIKSLSNVKEVAAGGETYSVPSSYYEVTSGFSLALKKDGTVWTWGSNFGIARSTNSGIVRDTIKDDLAPKEKEGLYNIIAIAAGGFHALALNAEGTVWSWGDNAYSQLGDGTHENSRSIKKVIEMKKIVAIAAGGLHSIALASDSTVWTWGDRPQVYNATKEFDYSPAKVENVKAIAVAAGKDHYLVLANNGFVWAWGQNRYGQLGNGSSKKMQYVSKPLRVVALDNVSAISAGMAHSMALKKDGTIWAWGNNGYGQLGDGTKGYKEIPTKTTTFSRSQPKKEKPAKAW